MNITEANAVANLIRTLAGSDRGDPACAQGDLEYLAIRAYKALGCGPSASVVRLAQDTIERLTS